MKMSDVEPIPEYDGDMVDLIHRWKPGYAGMGMQDIIKDAFDAEFDSKAERRAKKKAKSREMVIDGAGLKLIVKIKQSKKKK